MYTIHITVFFSYLEDKCIYCGNHVCLNGTELYFIVLRQQTMICENFCINCNLVPQNIFMTDIKLDLNTLFSYTVERQTCDLFCRTCCFESSSVRVNLSELLNKICYSRLSVASEPWFCKPNHCLQGRGVLREGHRRVENHHSSRSVEMSGERAVVVTTVASLKQRIYLNIFRREQTKYTPTFIPKM